MERVVSGDGMTYQYMGYNSLELRDYCRGNNRTFRTEVRVIPDDISYAFIHLPKEKRWIKAELVRPTYEFANNISLLQHQLIRKEAGEKLTQKNAEEELNNAWHRLRDRWSLAVSRGKALKRETDLIRLQNLTSARLLSKPGLSQSMEVPEASDALKLNFNEITPFKSFRIDEE